MNNNQFSNKYDLEDGKKFYAGEIRNHRNSVERSSGTHSNFPKDWFQFKKLNIENSMKIANCKIENCIIPYLVRNRVLTKTTPIISYLDHSDLNISLSALRVPVTAIVSSALRSRLAS